jgi:ABC-type uncharacterized transport system substrate-binding protein
VFLKQIGGTRAIVVHGNLWGSKDSAQRTILVVHSYDMEYSWVDAVNKGLHSALIEYPELTVHEFYMDTKRKAKEKQQIEAGLRALEQVKRIKPNLVIVSDDDAQEHFALQLRKISSVPIIFLGVNRSLKDYGYPLKGMTGVVERPFVDQAIAYCGQIIPNLRRIAFISDSSSTTFGLMQWVTQQKSSQLIHSYAMPHTFAEWQKSVFWANANADAILVYVYHSIKRNEQDSVSMNPSEVMEWTRKNAKVPSIALIGFDINDGALCGVVESGAQQGAEAGQLALRVLNGEIADSIPIVEPLRGQTQLNLQAAQDLGIRIPQDFIDSTSVVKGRKQ